MSTQLLITIPDLATLGKVAQALAALGVLGNVPGSAGSTAQNVASTHTAQVAQQVAAPAPAPDPFAAQVQQQAPLTWEQFMTRAQAWTKIGNNAAEFVPKMNAFGAANQVALPNVPAMQPMGPQKWAEFLAMLPGA
jgi:hypothetical protein